MFRAVSILDEIDEVYKNLLPGCSCVQLMKKSAHDHLRCTSKLGWGIRPHVFKNHNILENDQIATLRRWEILSCCGLLLASLPFVSPINRFSRVKSTGSGSFKHSAYFLNHTWVALVCKHKLNPKINLFRLSRFHWFKYKEPYTLVLAYDVRGTVTQLCWTSEALYLSLMSRYKVSGVTIALHAKCGTKRKLDPLTQNATRYVTGLFLLVVTEHH